MGGENDEYANHDLDAYASECCVAGCIDMATDVECDEYANHGLDADARECCVAGCIDMAMDLEGGQHASLDSDAEDVEERKEARKAKNRQSAAASRARQQAYTNSLELKVCPHLLAPKITCRRGCYA